VGWRDLVVGWAYREYGRQARGRNARFRLVRCGLTSGVSCAGLAPRTAARGEV